MRENNNPAYRMDGGAEATKTFPGVNHIVGERPLTTCLDTALLHSWADCVGYSERYFAKAHHDAVRDAFGAALTDVAAGWRAKADQLRAARPVPGGSETDDDLEAMRASWRDLTEQAKACEAKAVVTERYWAEGFEADYRAVMAEAVGVDPLEVAVVVARAAVRAVAA